MIESETAASTRVTLALINKAFDQRGNTRAFNTPTIEELKKKEHDAGRWLNGKPVSTHQMTRLHQALTKRIGPDIMKTERVEQLSKTLFEMDIKDPANIHSMSIDKIRVHVNAHVKEKGSGIQEFTLGEMMAAHAATDAKPSTAYKEVKLAPKVNMPISYDESTSKTEPIRTPIRVFRAIVTQMWREAGVSPYELADAIDGKRPLHATHDKLLEQLVLTNFTAQAVVSSLRGAKTMGIWKASGVDSFVEVAVFTCNFLLKDILTQLNKGGMPDSFDGQHPVALLQESVELDVIEEALEHHRKQRSFYNSVVKLGETYPKIKDKLDDVLKLAGTLTRAEMHDRVMIEFNSLDDSKTDDGDIFTTAATATMLRVDSAADASIVTPGVAHPDTLKDNPKTWNGAAKQKFRTTHSGEIGGKVSWNQRPRSVNETVKSGRVEFKAPCHVSTEVKENLLSLESVFDAEEWKYVTFQLDNEGKSYIYGTQGKRIPLHRLPGKRGWWLKVHHETCKSFSCSRIYGLIYVHAEIPKRTGPLDVESSRTTYIVKTKDSISLSCVSRYDPSHLSEPEIDIYGELEGVCNACQGIELGNVVIRSPRRIATGCSVYVTGIHEQLNKGDVTEMFDDFGKLWEVCFPMVIETAGSTQAAIITYNRPHEARRACRQMREFQMGGTRLRVST